MSIDLKWMSCGGLLLDGRGDLALETDPVSSVKDVIRSRLKADFDGWQLYRIGAGLQNRLGDTIGEELEVQIKRQVLESLSHEFLPSAACDVETVVTGPGKILVIVYLDNEPAVQAVISESGVEVQ